MLMNRRRRNGFLRESSNSWELCKKAKVLLRFSVTTLVEGLVESLVESVLEGNWTEEEKKSKLFDKRF